MDGMRIGKILQVTEAGEPVVDWPESGGPVRARTLVTFSRSSRADVEGTPVLLACLEGESSPVILGLVRDRLYEDDAALGASTGGRELRLCARSVILEGDRIELRAGPGSLTLEKSGDVRVRGRRVVSRATGVNRIKGASVSIN